MNSEDFIRFETKLDRLTEAVTQLVIVEERQSVQATAIKDLTERLTRAEQKLDMWINRGVGVWAVFATAIAIYKAMH